MKKIILSFLPLTLILNSCNKNNDYSFKVNVFKIKSSSLQVNDNEITFFYDLTTDDINYIKENKQDLFFFVNSPSCTATCSTFLTIFELFIKDNNILIPYIELGNFNKSQIKKETLNQSQFVIIKNGEIKVQNIVDDTSTTSFIKNFFSKYININNTFILNDLFYDDKQITYTSSIHFLYKNKKYNSRTYSLYNSLDSYSEDKILILKNNYNQQIIDDYLNDNKVTSLYFVTDLSNFNKKFNLNLNLLDYGYLIKENDTYEYQELTLSSTSLMS